MGDVSSVIDMSFMFTNANMFKRDLSKWDISSLKTILRIRGAVGGNDEKGRNGRLKWEGLNEVVKNKKGLPPNQGHSKVSFIPGPAGGVVCAGNIIPDYDGDGNRVGSAKCQTVIDASTTFLGFSKYTKALRLEVTGDGQPTELWCVRKTQTFGARIPCGRRSFPRRLGSVRRSSCP